MNTPSRREFFTYAAAATLASALPTQAQSKTDQTKKDTTLLPPNDPAALPLVVDVIGPMAFRWSGGKFELWMPDLTTVKNLKKPGVTPHQAGIMTTVTSIELKESGDYKITGPSESSGNPTVYSPQGGQVYETKVKDTSAPTKYIHMSLPMPHCLVVLDPVGATVSGSAPKASGIYATGVRLFYDQANKPELWYPDGHSLTIPFYASQYEKQTNMLIGYAPYDSADPHHEHAKASFHEVSLLFPPLDLQVDFEPEPKPISALYAVPAVGRFNDCKSLVIGLDGSS